MPTGDPRIDAYVAKAQPFARPILRRLRAIVHKGCPEVTETIKWGFPHFEHHGILCSMAAFKAHCVFGFWQGRDVVATGSGLQAMGDFGRIESLADLPTERRLVALVKKAAAMNESGQRPARPVKHAKGALPRMPVDFRRALDSDERAAATYAAFPPSARRDYLEWIVEAKQAGTRERRIATAVAWLAEGKRRNWKYERAK